MYRPFDFARGSHVPSAALDGIQDMMAGLVPATDTANGATAVGLRGADGRWWTTPDAGVPNGQLRVIDTRVDWRNRRVWGSFRRLGAADQRPGQANDHTPNDPAAATAARRFHGWTGAGGVGAASAAVANGTPPVFADNCYAVLLDELASTALRVYLYARPSDGALCVYNASGAALHADLLVWGAAAAPSVGSAPGVPGRLVSADGLETTDATWTTAVTATLAQSSQVTFRVAVSAIRSTGAEGGSWEFSAGFRRPSSGAPVAVGSTLFLLVAADDATWDVRIQVSGSDVVIQVKGAAGKTVRWRVEAATTEARA